MGSEKHSLWFIITALQTFAYYLQVWPLQPILNWLCRRRGIYRKFASRQAGSDEFADADLIPLLVDAIKESTEIHFALGELGHRFIDNQEILTAINDAYQQNGVITLITHGPRIDPETKKIFDLARTGAVKLYTLVKYPTGHFGIFKRRNGTVSIYDEEPHSEVLWERDRRGKPRKLHSSQHRARYFRKRSIGLANAREAEFTKRLKQATPTPLDPNNRPGYEHHYKYPFLRILGSGALNFFYWVAIEPIEILSDKKLTLPIRFAKVTDNVSIQEREQHLKGEGIKHQVRTALHQVIESPENNDLLGRFKDAYEYRKQFPWLGESGRMPGEQDGVAYALRESLASYVPEASQAVSAKEDLKKSHTDIKRRENGWKTRVAKSVEEALADPIRLQQFADSVSESGEEVIEPRQIEKHVAKALEQYYKQHKLNTSSDPW